ncbi:unnamed protein product [Fusarium langsethiae]|nr:unnamed protein product [Fusarium langsethiae]
MRFGRNFHRWQVPSWIDSYVNYSYLKDLVRGKSPITALKEAIEFEISVVDGFLARQNRVAEAQIDVLSEHWGIEIGSTRSLEYHGVSKYELEDLQASLLECAHDVAQFHHYAKVNHDALSRILDKAAAIYDLKDLCNVTSLSRLADWCQSLLSCLSQLNNTLRLLGEVKNREETDTVPRSLLLERFGLSHFPAETIRCLMEDNVLQLDTSLKRRYPNPSTERRSVLTVLIQVATIHQAVECQAVLLATLRLESGQETTMHDNPLHQILQSLSKSQQDSNSPIVNKAFSKTLELLGPSQSFLLQKKDSLGRSPLHYAARLGLDGICKAIITAIRAEPLKTCEGEIYIFPDIFGLTPLDYAVQRGFAAVVELLLQELKFEDLSDRRDANDTLGILATAVCSKSIDIATLLIREGWGVRFVNRFGQTVLHLAAERGLSIFVETLIALGIDVNASDNVRGWTPLFSASVQGHNEMVEALLQAGAKTQITDQRGWLAQDYAAYRGHMQILKSMRARGSANLTSKPGDYFGKLNVLPHRSSADSVIFLYLGTLNLLKEAAGVDITQYRRSVSPIYVPDTCLDVSVSLCGEPDQVHTLSLPIISEISDQPCCFTVRDPDNASIMFKVTSPLEERPVGIAIALLNTLKESLGANRESLVRDFTLPLINDRHGRVGTVVFTFIVARPLSFEQQAPTESQSLQLESFSSLGGHRGNGQNDKSPCLQVGENSLQSFKTAVEHGADVIEFGEDKLMVLWLISLRSWLTSYTDVQLTKDDIPVVYHDFLVVEKGCDVPMHALTLEQFIDISRAQSPSQSFHDIPSRLPWDERDRPRAIPNLRRSSLGPSRDSTTEALVSQMKHTLNYPGFKSNLRGNSIHEPFMTLEDLLFNLSEDVPLDIELKYPMLYEAEDFHMDTFAIEVNHFLDKILCVVYSHAGPRRRIIFSSFSPEICMVLMAKQQPYPILFLNDSSNYTTGDMRATSLQAAVRFAHRFGLAGVAMASEPFVASPGLAGFVRRQGLYTATYGPLNDDVDGVKIQAEAGIDLIIVNKVKQARQTLSKMKT